jgi:hypothetical protein
MRFVYDHEANAVAIYTDERPSSTTTLLGWIMGEENGQRLIDMATDLNLTGAMFDTRDEAIEFAKTNLASA